MKQSLNFDWSFIEGFHDDYLKSLDKSLVLTVNIPHNPVEIPYNYFSEESYQKVFTYEKIFDVKDFDINNVYVLQFDGYMFKARIYLNGHELGEHYSGYNPVKLDISKFIKEKDNRLLVVLDSKEDIDYPPFGFALDYLTFSGIYREVSLISHLSTYLDNFYVHADMNGNIHLLFDKVGNDSIEISHQLFDEGNSILEFKEEKAHLDNPKLWDVDHPHLYTLVTTIKLGDKEEKLINKFGFRNAEFRKDGFYLNNKKTKLVGLNRHQGYAYMGYAASKTLQEDDAVLLKQTGLNIVRTSHYPQSEHFLSKCDEIGLLVVDEIPGWQHIGESDIWKKHCVNNAKEMVLKERNHTCVIIYGVRIDESVDNHELYTQTNKIAHELDPYRQTIGVRNFTNSELLEDVYGYNDFSCWDVSKGKALLSSREVKHGKNAHLVTEYMGHMDPVKGTSDIAKKIEVALKHARILDKNMGSDDIAGAIGWCFVDYQSHTDFGSGDHLCTHGVYDLYRNPKLSSYIYASQQDEIPVIEPLANFKPGDVPAAIFNDLYIATNCDYIELYKDNEFVKKFYPRRDVYKYMKHPPILIDDIVGYTFNEAKFPKKIHLKIAGMLSYAAIYGFNSLPLKTKLYLAYCMKRYKMDFTELVGYWNKYIGAWGGKAKTYTIKGFKDGKCVKEAELGPSNVFHFEYKLNKDELVNEDTYDTLAIHIRHLDEHNALLNYSQRVVRVEVEGPLSLIGPKEQSLLGGQLTLYFNSLNKKGESKITLKIDNEVKEFIIPVK